MDAVKKINEITAFLIILIQATGVIRIIFLLIKMAIEGVDESYKKSIKNTALFLITCTFAWEIAKFFIEHYK